MSDTSDRPADTPARSGTAGTQSIRRAVEALKAVAQLQRSGASLSRVAHSIGLNTSTTFRMLRALSEEGLLEYNSGSRHYFIGSLAFELGLAAHQKEDTQTQWYEVVKNIARETRLTTYLMARSGREAVCRYCIQGTMVLRAIPIDVGDRVPLGMGAGSLAILATLDDGEITSILDSQKMKLAEIAKSDSSTESILDRVSLARRRGFAVSNGTLAEGVSGLGVALSSNGLGASLAISVSAVGKKLSSEKAESLAEIINAEIKNFKPHPESTT